jgi:uncharacterized membrane protein YhaH (DUF805 family)
MFVHIIKKNYTDQFVPATYPLLLFLLGNRESSSKSSADAAPKLFFFFWLVYSLIPCVSVSALRFHCFGKKWKGFIRRGTNTIDVRHLQLLTIIYLSFFLFYCNVLCSQVHTLGSQPLLIKVHNIH